MVRISRRRIRGAAAALLILVVGTGTVVVLAMGTAPASAATKVPTLLATPHTKLTDGQVVKVHGLHLTPGDEVILLECQKSSDLPIGCDLLTSTPVTVSATGQVPATNFTVNSGLVGTGTCGTSAADAKNCKIVAEDLSAPHHQRSEHLRRLREPLLQGVRVDRLHDHDDDQHHAAPGPVGTLCRRGGPGRPGTRAGIGPVTPMVAVAGG